MAATLYLAGSIFVLFVAATSWFQARRIGPLVSWYFFTGWFVGELALQAIIIIVTLAFAAFGAFDEPRGLVVSRSAHGVGTPAAPLRAQGAARGRRAARASVRDRPRRRSRTHGFSNPFR
jgi:hypothetical protein